MRALVAASFELRQPRHHDVLAAVERAGILLFLVLRERQLALPAPACPASRLRRSATRRSSRASATFSDRLSDTYSPANMLTALAANSGSDDVNVMSTSWLPRTWPTPRRPSKRVGIARCGRDRGRVGAGVSACVEVIRRYGHIA